MYAERQLLLTQAALQADLSCRAFPAVVNVNVADGLTTELAETTQVLWFIRQRYKKHTEYICKSCALTALHGGTIGSAVQLLILRC